MTQLHAQPYNTIVGGFFFESEDEYHNNIATLRHAFGDTVEEFEIQFIDGERIDCDLAQAIGINQANLKLYLDAVDDWDEDDKTRVILYRL